MGFDDWTRIRAISGRSMDHVAVLARRGPYEEIVEHDGSDFTDSYVVRVRDGAVTCAHRTHELLCGLWLDRAGAIWAGQYDHVLRLDERAEPVRIEVPAELIAGLDDGRLFCAAGDQVRQIADGSIVELPPLPERVRVLVGAGGSLFAGGGDFCARWDGVCWHLFGEIDDNLDALHPLGDDAVLAGGSESARAWSFRDGAWTLLSDLDPDVADIAWWGGSVWIAAGEDGVRCDGKPHFENVSGVVHTIVGGDHLLIATHDMVIASSDGKHITDIMTTIDIDGFATEGT